MRNVKKTVQVFSAMPRSEKFLVIAIAIIALLSFVKFLLVTVPPPISKETGVFNEGMVGSLKTVNPLFVDFNDTDRDVSLLVFSGLMRYDPVARNFLPDLAESWERSRDGLTYKFTLKKNVLWHDGEVFSIDDVLFTFNGIIKRPSFRNPILKNTFEDIIVSQEGQNTVVFVLPQPNSYFISDLTVGILPKHIFQDIPVEALERSPLNLKPVGTGPYKVSDIRFHPDGDKVDLEMFIEYYGEKPFYRRIQIFTFSDEKLLLSQIDGLNSLSKLTQSGAEAVFQDSRFNVYQYSLNQFTALYFNTDNLFLQDKKVRQALALALNKDELVTDGEKRVDGLNLESKEDTAAFSANLELANKTLDELEFKRDKGGIRADDKGKQMKFKLLVFSKISSQLADKIKDQFSQVAVDVDINTEGAASFTDLVNQRNYDILLVKQNLGYNRDVFPLFHSSQIGEGGLNFANFRSFKTDGTTEAIRKETDSPSKEKLLIELSKVLAEEIPVIFISTPVYSYALDKAFSALPDMSLDFHADRFKVIPNQSL